MIETLNAIDGQVYLFFNAMHTEFLDRLMMMATGRFVWIPMYAMVLLILFRNFKPKQALLFMLGIILAVTFADQICSTVLRPIFHRLRPSNPDNPISEFATLVNGYRGGKYGFPSCHAANSFALAVFLFNTINHRRFRIFILGWAVINSYTRLYLGVHYPGDLIVGAFIGSMIGFGMYRLTIKMAMRDSERHSLEMESGIPFPPIFTMAGARQTLVRPSDIMLGIGGFTFFILAFIAVF